MPDIEKFERIVFQKKNTLDLLLSFSLKLLQARHVGVLLGTNKTYLKFLPPEKWDRGVMHKFDGNGMSGLMFKYFGTAFVKRKGLSPIMLYRETQFGEKIESDGIISFVLRTHKEFYEKGLKIVIIDGLQDSPEGAEKAFVYSTYSYDGKVFDRLPGLRINTAIVRQFRAKNFVSAYIPDYGAIVFNTIDENLLANIDEKFNHTEELTKRLDMLIAAIEMASIAYIGSAKGRQAAHIIWRKEKNLRRTALELKEKAVQLNAQKAYLKAVGAVDERQLVNITDGVYAFMDMVGSALIRKKFQPRDYFLILNLCHQIAADNASRYACRVDNFIGDSVFLVNASPFDEQGLRFSPAVHERAMLMIFTLASIFNEIRLLTSGRHPMDKEGRIKELIHRAKVSLGFRAGLEIGPAMIGPLGSRKRRIVTAIGKAVNTASRLESTGIKDEIHIGDGALYLIKEACVTRDTGTIWKILFKSKGFDRPMLSNGPYFLDCYRQFFNIKEEVVYERKNIAYKEFSKDVSFMIKCIPESSVL
ncbi:MAG: adenylate/guanylate cyclase domain-containing protein [Desulfobacula sp.]|nr:adenylate/guanylate cyclase domain-containing protein [Desulfobacula sp.]